MKIAIAITSVGAIDPIIYHNHLSCLTHWAKHFDIFPMHLGDNPQCDSLNVMVHAAIQEKCDYVLFLEHDNTYNKDMLQDLLDANKDVVSGYYTFRNWPYEPIPLRKEANGMIYRYEYCDGDDSKPNLVQMTIGCFGCQLVKIDVLKKLFDKGLKFRQELHKKSGATLTTDVVFYRDCLDNGIEIWVDGRIRLGHLGHRMRITPDNFRVFRQCLKLLEPGLVPPQERFSEEREKEVREFLLKDERLTDESGAMPCLI